LPYADLVGALTTTLKFKIWFSKGHAGDGELLFSVPNSSACCHAPYLNKRPLIFPVTRLEVCRSGSCRPSPPSRSGRSQALVNVGIRRTLAAIAFCIRLGRSRSGIGIDVDSSERGSGSRTGFGDVLSQLASARRRVWCERSALFLRPHLSSLVESREDLTLSLSLSLFDLTGLSLFPLEPCLLAFAKDLTSLERTNLVISLAETLASKVSQPSVLRASALALNSILRDGSDGESRYLFIHGVTSTQLNPLVLCSAPRSVQQDDHRQSAVEHRDPARFAAGRRTASFGRLDH
jgi:hypothetical protein